MKHENQTLKILLIEDDYDDELLIYKELERSGFDPVILRVQTEAALRIAVEAASGWDLVLCDFLLPSYSPYKALSLIREKLDGIPFIVLSGFEDEAKALEILKAGANDYVYKSQMGRLPLVIRRELRSSGERISSKIEIEKSYLETVEAWGNMLELRDRFTSDHTIRVTDLTLRFARALGVSSHEFNTIRFGALLHDIGKMGIPDSILLKQDALTLEEIKTMRLHPQLAYDHLSKIAYLKAAAVIPYCHHEKFDGTGYPRGLKGIEIPFAARLFSIVDVWDALTNDRPYRRPWLREKAISYLREEKGKSFDPDLVEKFIEVIHE